MGSVAENGAKAEVVATLRAAAAVSASMEEAEEERQTAVAILSMSMVGQEWSIRLAVWRLLQLPPWANHGRCAS